MKVKITASMRAHRTLRHTARFSFCDASKPLPDDFQYRAEQSGKIIGWYDNATGDFKDNVIVAENGIFVPQPSGWRFVPYLAMKQITAPRKGVRDSQIGLEVEQGQRLEVPICGEGEIRGTRDAFAFLRFLDRVCGDLANTDGPPVANPVPQSGPLANVNFEAARPSS